MNLFDQSTMVLEWPRLLETLAPTAEPVGDLEAQIKAMDGKKRRGVYLSPDNVNHLYATQRADLIRGRNFVANLDGQGGVLVVDSPQTEYEVKQRLNPTQAPGMKPEPRKKSSATSQVPGKASRLAQPWSYRPWTNGATSQPNRLSRSARKPLRRERTSA